MFKRVKFAAILACFVIATLGVVPTAGASLPPEEELQQKGPTVELVASKADQQAAARMWTREARAAAKAMRLPSVRIDESSLEAEAESTQGTPGFAPAGKPDPNADITAQAEFAEEFKAALAEMAAEEVEPTGTAGIYTSYLGNYYSQMWTYFPWRAVGKLYFRDSAGNRYSCTASVISPYNVIVTAGHCVYNTDTNRWYTGWSFVPAARSSSTPYGTFPWTLARVLTAWQNAPNYASGRRYDVALIKLGNNSAGRPVTYYTGYLGRSWNYGYVQNVHIVGYPSNISSGYYQNICTAETYYVSTDLVGAGCNMTYGSSGGPWIRVYRPYTSGANNYVNGTTSGLNTAYPGNLYGPRFSSYNIVPLCSGLC